MYLYLRYREMRGYELRNPLGLAFAFDLAVLAFIVWVLT